ncbi:MAG: alanine racemase [Chloracidobacterium sp. CP2_5A]|nr:MAG: alanine racemase [Chloracidobacterium sp. CP2_5A]
MTAADLPDPLPDLLTIPTPALILDLERLTRNIARMSAHVARLGARLRPHIKTHKCPPIARQQVAGWFGGVTISTLAEGFAFADAGFDDLLYAVPLEPGKFRRACDLARRVRRLAVITDDPDLPPLLSAAAMAAGVALDVFIEIDCGDGRTGLPFADAARIARTARAIAGAKGLALAGVLTHAGQAYAARAADERRAIAELERDRMQRVAAELERLGLEAPCVSIGSTPAIVALDAPLPPNFEVRPGNYAFFDAFQAQCGVCAFDDCALTVLTAVIHRGADKVVTDAGAIALSKDIGASDFFAKSGYGLVGDVAGRSLGLRVAAVAQEHGRIPVPDRALLDRLPLGARLRIAPNHSCLTAAQHAHYWVVVADRVVDRWPVARGW